MLIDKCLAELRTESRSATMKQLMRVENIKKKLSIFGHSSLKRILFTSQVDRMICISILK